MVNLISIGITVVSYKSPIRAVKYVKMFCLKLLEIYLNIILETVVFGVQGYILIKPMYNKLIVSGNYI